MRSAFLLLGAALAALSVAACELPFQSCTTAACSQGDEVEIAFSFRERGTYRFELNVDGFLTTCTATLPLASDGGCDRAEVRLIGSGSMLSADQQTLGPLKITRAMTNHVDVRAYKDEQPAGTASFSVSYTETPGVNGPGCDPDKCVAASGGTLQ